MVTDTQGKKLLIDDLGLEFDVVSLALDGFDAPPGMWSLGKIKAYTLQEGPFIHLDHDAFLWNPLPARILSASVAAWAPERHYRERQQGYKTGWMARNLEYAPACFLQFANRPVTIAVNCGLFGGNDISCIRDFASECLKMATHPANKNAWARLREETGGLFHATIFLEQCLIGYFVLSHRTSLEYLHDSNSRTISMGADHTHLLGRRKRIAGNMRIMRERSKALFPNASTRAQSAGTDLATIKNLPGCAGQYAGKKLLILGSGLNLWSEMEEAKAIFGECDLMVINMTYFALEGQHRHGVEKITHWVSLHADFFEAFANRKGDIITHSAASGDINKGRRMKGVDALWELNHFGTSGQFAVKVAFLLGYYKIILCGIPITSERKFYDPPGAFCHEIRFDTTWAKIKPLLNDKVRSMSGNTAELFGRPTLAWANATSADASQAHRDPSA